MEYLSEDPTYLAGGLGIAGLGFLIALKATQQGKYLIYAGAALGLALLVLLVEQVWVTDNERIESVVYSLADAVSASNGERAAEFLDKGCKVEFGSGTSRMTLMIKAAMLGTDSPREWLRTHLDDIKFDWLKISKLRTNAGRLSGMGTAEFVAHTAGTQREPVGNFMTPPSGMSWSFGLRETTPGIWKITRISPGRVETGPR